MGSLVRSAATASVTNPFRVLRVWQWMHFLPLPAAAFGAERLKDPHALHELVLAAISAGGALAYAYGLNAVTDRGSDERTEKNPLAGVASVGADVWIAIACAPLAALAAAIPLGSTGVVACAASLACGSLYSAGPRAKRVPLIGLIANLGIFVPLLWLAFDPAKVPAAFASLCFAFSILLVQNQLVHESADVREDRASGARTTALWLGDRATEAAIALLGGAGAAALAIVATSPALAVLGPLLVLVPTITALIGGSCPDDRRIRHRVASALSGAVLFAACLGVEAI